MPFRLFSYMLQIWNCCVKEAGENSKRKGSLLPSILLVVFYEGSLRWIAVKNFTEKVGRSENFRGYITDFSYCLISLWVACSISPAPQKGKILGNVRERIRKLLLSLPSKEGELLAKHFLEC